MARSIRVRLQVWYAVVLTAVVAGFAGILYYEVRAARLAELDRQLETTAAGLDSALRLFPPHELTGEPPPWPPPPNGRPPKGRPPKGPEFGPGPPPRDRLLAGLDLPGPPSERPKDLYFAIWRADGMPLKMLRVPTGRPAPATDRGRPAPVFRDTNRELAVRGPEATVILVGRPAGDVAAGLRTFAWQLTATGVGVLAIGLAGGWWISRRIFRPIAAIAATASRISAANLSERIDTRRVDSELAELAGVLNQTFERMQAAFDQQTRFTADASHELRTPLAVIRSQAELTLSRARDSAEYQEALRVCLRAAGRMTNLVEALLALARADAGHTDADRKELEWDRVVADAVDLCQPLAEEKGVRLVTELAAARVVGDPVALSRAVANLVVNAIQYSRREGEVRVTSGVDGPQAVLEVRDTGPGIAPEHQPYLFERFYRADTARSRATGGSGLGLAIAKAVVEAHGGAIGFDSTAGKGSTFWVRLPLAGSSTEAPAPRGRA